MDQKLRLDSCSMEALVAQLVNRVTKVIPNRGDLTKANDAQLCQLNSAVALEINRRFGDFDEPTRSSTEA